MGGGEKLRQRAESGGRPWIGAALRAGRESSGTMRRQCAHVCSYSAPVLCRARCQLHAHAASCTAASAHDNSPRSGPLHTLAPNPVELDRLIRLSAASKLARRHNSPAHSQVVGC